MFWFRHVSIFLQQLMDVTGLKDFTIFVVIVVLIHVGEVVGLQHPAGTTLLSFILINYTSYTTANFRWLRYIAVVITLGDWFQTECRVLCLYWTRKNWTESKSQFFVQNRIKIDRLAKISYRHSTSSSRDVMTGIQDELQRLVLSDRRQMWPKMEWRQVAKVLSMLGRVVLSAMALLVMKHSSLITSCLL